MFSLVVFKWPQWEKTVAEAQVQTGVGAWVAERIIDRLVNPQNQLSQDDPQLESLRYFAGMFLRD
jgi:hypothetical protein